jgi:hypothetical protein
MNFSQVMLSIAKGATLAAHALVEDIGEISMTKDLDLIGK